MVGLDVTMKTVMNQEYLAALNNSGSTTGTFIYRISRFYQDYHHREYGLDGIHTHDPSAIAYVIDPTLFTTQRGSIRVATEGLALGQTLWDRRQNWSEVNAWTDRPAVNVCLDVDSSRLLAMYQERITAGR
jgi:inosine-uridine nucleoside N-ribohydrolase